MIRLLFILAVIVSVLYVLRSALGGGGGPGRSRFKCATCAHCRSLFGDGVMCGFEERKVFKNPVQIEMCPDHTHGP